MSEKYPETAAILKRAFGDATQKEIAKRLRVQQSTVSHWLRGRCQPSPAAAVRIERQYGMSRRWILPDFPWS